MGLKKICYINNFHLTFASFYDSLRLTKDHCDSDNIKQPKLDLQWGKTTVC